METQELRLVKSKHETASDFVVIAIYAVAVYYMLVPGAFERHREVLQQFGEKCLYRVSVWQARQAIQSLPETDVTRNK